MTSLDRDTLFVALTRPLMFAGVTYSFFVANAVVTTELFVLFKSAWFLLFALVFHLVGYVACLKEPRFLELMIMRFARCPRVANHRYWRCNSYNP